MNLNESFNRLKSYCRWLQKPSENETHQLTLRLWEFESKRPEKVEFFNLDHLMQLRNDLDLLIEASKGTEFYKFIWLTYLNQIYQTDKMCFYAFPDKESEMGVCISFWYGDDQQPNYPPEFLLELDRADSETELASYCIVEKDCIAFIKNRSQSIGYEKAETDAAYFIQRLIDSGH